MRLTTLRLGQALDWALLDPHVTNMLSGLAAIYPGLMRAIVLDNLLLVAWQLHLEQGL